MRLFRLTEVFFGIALLGVGAIGQTSSVVYEARSAKLTADGKTDDSAALNNAIASAIAGNYGTVQLPCGQIMVNKAINLTNRSNLTLRGCGANQDYGPPYPLNDTQILCNTGSVCLDMTGASSVKLENLSLRIATKFQSPSTVGVMMGRDDAGGGGRGVFCYSQFNHFDNFYLYASANREANSGRGYIGIYNVGAEHFILSRSKITASTPLFFAATNILNLKSPYQTLETGCPVSMTGVLLDDVSVTATYGNGLEAWDAGEFLFNFFEVDYAPAAKQFALALNGRLIWQFKGHIHVENPNAPGNFLSIATKTTDHVDLEANVGGANGVAPYVNLNGNDLIITNSKLSVRCQTGECQTMFTNGGARNQWRGGEIDLGTTVPPLNASNLGLIGTTVHADRFTDAQVKFAPGSQYILLDDAGVSIVGKTR